MLGRADDLARLDAVRDIGVSRQIPLLVDRELRRAAAFEIAVFNEMMLGRFEHAAFGRFRHIRISRQVPPVVNRDTAQQQLHDIQQVAIYQGSVIAVAICRNLVLLFEKGKWRQITHRRTP